MLGSKAWFLETSHSWIEAAERAQHACGQQLGMGAMTCCKEEQGRAGQSRAEQGRAEQSRAEQSRAEQSRAEQSRAEQSRAEQSTAEQYRADKNQTAPHQQKSCEFS